MSTLRRKTKSFQINAEGKEVPYVTTIKERETLQRQRVAAADAAQEAWKIHRKKFPRGKIYGDSESSDSDSDYKKGGRRSRRKTKHKKTKKQRKHRTHKRT